MKIQWSKQWISSIKGRKQRKYIKKAPLHIKHKMLSSTLDKSLREHHKIRSVPTRKGDEVLIMKGQFSKHKGRVEKISVSKMRVYVQGAVLKRNDGSEVLYPIHPSNLKIIKLDLTDRKRNLKIQKMEELNKK